MKAFHSGAWLPAHSPVSWKAQDLRLMWWCQKVEANLISWNFPELPISTAGLMWVIKQHLFLKPLGLWVACYYSITSPFLMDAADQTRSAPASSVVCIFFCCPSGQVPVPLLYRGSYPQFSRWGRREKEIGRSLEPRVQLWSPVPTSISELLCFSRF